MTTRMLIDARHREETRVAVVKGNRIEEFDFESAERKQLKGNIYLAKVTRVEPSLQAAFIDYGGNRHGFLAFSEIHPDYYQIPKEDRDDLLREEAEHAAEEAALRAADDNDDDDESEDDDGFEARDADDSDDGDDHVDDDDHGDEESQEDESGEGRARKPRGANDDQVEALRQRRLNLRRRYKIQDVIRRRQVLLVQVVKEERGSKGAALTTYLSLAGRYCVLMPNTSHGGGISRKISNAGDRKRLKSIMADLALPPSMGCIVRTAGLQRTKVEIKRDFDYLARLWDGIRETTLASAAPALVYGDSDLMKRAIRDIYNKDIDEVIVEGEDGYRHAKEFMKLLMPSHAKKVKHYSDPVPLFQRAGVEDQLSAMYHPVVQLKSGGYLVINPTEALVSIDINSGRSTREHNIEQTATATNLEAAHEIARQLRLRDMAGLVVIDFIDMDNNSNVRKVEKAMKEAMKNDRARIQVGRISSFGLMEMSRQRLRTGVLEASTRPCPHCEGSGFVRTASSAGLSALRLIEDEAARGRGSILTLRASQEAAFYVLNRKRADIAEIEDRYGVHVEIMSDGEQEGARMSVEASGPPPAHAPRFDAVIQEDDDEDYVEEAEDEVEAGDAEEEERDARPHARGEGRAEAEGEGGRRRRRRRGRRGRDRDEAPVGSEEVADEDREAEAVAPTGAAPEALEGEEHQTTEEREDREERDENGEPRKRRGRRGRRGGRRTPAGLAADTEAVEGAAPEPLPQAVEPEAEAQAEPAPAVESEVVSEAESEAPKKTRRRPRARAADEIGSKVPAAAPAAEAAPAKPRRGRRAAAAPVVESAAEPAAVEPDTTEPKINEPAPVAAAADPTPVVEAEEPKPKPKRRAPRRKADVPAVVEAEEAPAAIPLDGAAPADNNAQGPDSAQTPEAAPEVAPEADTGPRRSGWWQRTFGA